MTVAKGRSSLGSSTRTLKVGDRAPEIALRSHTGEDFKLSEQRGHTVVLAFYPFAFTPVCSNQVPTYEAELDRFTKYGAAVVGISTDSRHANAAWAKSLGGISFPLLSDFYPHGAVAEAYGILRPEGMAERALFIVDKDGVIRYIDVHELGEQPDEEQLFEELARLQ